VLRLGIIFAAPRSMAPMLALPMAALSLSGAARKPQAPARLSGAASAVRLSARRCGALSAGAAALRRPAAAPKAAARAAPVEAKLKTRKSAAKRYKVTASGKVWARASCAVQAQDRPGHWLAASKPAGTRAGHGRTLRVAHGARVLAAPLSGQPAAGGAGRRPRVSPGPVPRKHDGAARAAPCIGRAAAHAADGLCSPRPDARSPRRVWCCIHAFHFARPRAFSRLAAHARPAAPSTPACPDG
jgi:hypothetical protein